MRAIRTTVLILYIAALLALPAQHILEIAHETSDGPACNRTDVPDCRTFMSEDCRPEHPCHNQEHSHHNHPAHDDHCSLCASIQNFTQHLAPGADMMLFNPRTALYGQISGDSACHIFLPSDIDIRGPPVL